MLGTGPAHSVARILFCLPCCLLRDEGWVSWLWHKEVYFGHFGQLSVMCMIIHPGDWLRHSWDRRRSCIRLHCCSTDKSRIPWCPAPSIYIDYVAMGWLGLSPSRLNSVGCLCSKRLIFSSLNQRASLDVLFAWWWQQHKRWAETHTCLKSEAQNWCNVPSTSFHWPKPGSWSNTRSIGGEICPNLLMGGTINSFGKELNTERGQELGQKLYPW